MPPRALTTLERSVATAAAHRDRAIDRAHRKRRGVVHTPPELARFVAESLDTALRRHLGCANGLADRSVALVDPACGPGAFLAAALAVARDRPSAPRAFVGLDVDAVAIAHARSELDHAAERARWPLALRAGNTLDAIDPFGERAAPVRVVIGNPPWAGRTANAGARATAALLDDFRRDAGGALLDEKKIGVLSDDYVRFFRWAAELARSGEGGGAFALVTNGSFLDGPVHRGMRAALVRWFDGIDVVDLGGSALVARTGARDDNVFGVRPNVAVTIAWRKSGAEPRRGRVRYVALRGSRDEKLAGLRRPLAWRSLAADAPPHLFVPGPPVRRAPSDGWIALSRAMPFHREGVQTNRDRVAIDASRERLLERIDAFARGAVSADLAAALAPSRHYDPARARAAVREALERGEATVRPIAYRPFDDRWVATIAPLCHRPRPELLDAIDRSSLVLLTVRKDRGQRAWAHFGATRHVPDNCWLSTRSSCRTRAFPTRFPDGRPNLDPELAERWSVAIGAKVDVESFARYALAILASATYRGALDRALRLDYPVLPPPRDAASFREAVDAGESLAAALSPTGDGERGDAAVTIGHVRIERAPIALTHALARADEAARANGVRD